MPIVATRMTAGSTCTPYMVVGQHDVSQVKKNTVSQTEVLLGNTSSLEISQWVSKQSSSTADSRPMLEV